MIGSFLRQRIVKMTTSPDPLTRCADGIDRIAVAMERLASLPSPDPSDSDAPAKANPETSMLPDWLQRVRERLRLSSPTETPVGWHSEATDEASWLAEQPVETAAEGLTDDQ